LTVVVDASVVVSLWLDPVASPSIADRLGGESLYAPEHLLVEATNVLRRRRNAGLLDLASAETAFAALMEMPVQLWPFSSIAQRAWRLGANASSYDAAYLALAERLSAPLLTRDARLSRVPGARCTVVVV
jgi:predicted nucleic acid-binding protein